MRIQLMLPIYKTMEAPCVQSLVDMQTDFYQAGDVMQPCFANGFNAARARVCLARHAGEDTKFGADYVLWVDSDHLYLKTDFNKLVNAMSKNDLPMLAASYKMRGSEETAHGITEDGKFRHFHYKELNELTPGTLVECGVVGFGFLVMRADFIKKMWAKYKEDLFKLDAINNATEDVTFCNLMRAEGYKVMFDPSVRVGHMETCVRI
jgi:GT2 family glycosyltransferase